MKRHFLTGLAILLPAILTIAIVAFLVHLFTDPFIYGIESIINYYQAEGQAPWTLRHSLVLSFIVRLIVLTVIFSFIILIGFLTRTFFIYSFFIRTDKLIHRIPLVNKLYKAIQEVSRTLFSSKSNSFKQVVLIPYPNESTVSIGFVTSDITSESEDPRLKDKIPVFVAGTPNPTFGFILMFPRDQVVYIDMKVEDAFKILVSCGIMLPGKPDERKS